MDITPIYELKTRLRAAAVAGTNLLSEDFRLKRAVEDLQPLEAASPVFAKIGQLSRTLLVQEEENKEKNLLDALTLIDALLCTQGEVSVSGEIKQLSLTKTENTIINAPYSSIKGMLDALTTTGSGRWEYLHDIHDNQPQLFEDYRVRPALVQALGDGYVEIANDMTEWIKQMGKPMLALLEKNFNPKGKSDMLRRVQIIDEVAGEDANGFYIEQYPEAEKEVRKALIYALRHSSENNELLSGLVKTEKGNAKKMAHYAFACQESKEAEEYFTKLMEKKPEDALEYLRISSTEWSCELVAKNFSSFLDDYEHVIYESKACPDAASDEIKILLAYIRALQGKNNDDIITCWKRAAKLANSPKMLNVTLADYEFGYYRKACSLHGMIATYLRENLFIRQDKEIIELAKELHDTYGKYFHAAVLARLISEEDSTRWFREQIKNGRTSDDFAKSFIGICWNNDTKTWIISSQVYNPIAEYGRSSAQMSIRQNIKGDFTEFALSLKDVNMDTVIKNSVPTGDDEYKNTIMEYFYKRALENPEYRMYCNYLKANGFKKCENLAVSYLKSAKPMYSWSFINYIENLPGDTEAVKKEVLEVNNMLKHNFYNKKIKDMDNNKWQEFLDTFAWNEEERSKL